MNEPAKPGKFDAVVRSILSDMADGMPALRACGANVLLPVEDAFEVEAALERFSSWWLDASQGARLLWLELLTTCDVSGRVNEPIGDVARCAGLTEAEGETAFAYLERTGCVERLPGAVIQVVSGFVRVDAASSHPRQHAAEQESIDGSTQKGARETGGHDG